MKPNFYCPGAHGSCDSPRCGNGVCEIEDKRKDQLMTGSNATGVRELHDRLGAMIDQIGQPDYSLRELVAGMREVRDDLFALSENKDSTAPQANVVRAGETPVPPAGAAPIDKSCSYPTCGCAWTQDECPYYARNEAMRSAPSATRDIQAEDELVSVLLADPWQLRQFVRKACVLERSFAESSTAPSTDTPRTDAIYVTTKPDSFSRVDFGDWLKMLDHARRLERELTAAQSATTPLHVRLRVAANDVERLGYSGMALGLRGVANTVEQVGVVDSGSKA